MKNFRIKIGAEFVKRIQLKKPKKSNRSEWIENVLHNSFLKKFPPKQINTSLLLLALQKDTSILVRIEDKTLEKLQKKSNQYNISATLYTIVAIIEELNN